MSDTFEIPDETEERVKGDLELSIHGEGLLIEFEAVRWVDDRFYETSGWERVAETDWDVEIKRVDAFALDGGTVRLSDLSPPLEAEITRRVREHLDRDPGSCL